ncbi:hypothetical protein ACJ73_07342 [Blastomyces percursus]|uniref:Uncharacterized protein n=1 Tax=Blastomyces percursus TaxID=1658174 RepID=A0A1J9PYC9_9EURO|nr:hypothetical protein ACJ73_07342 [Blastomyces percursus]
MTPTSTPVRPEDNNSQNTLLPAPSGSPSKPKGISVLLSEVRRATTEVIQIDSDTEEPANYTKEATEGSSDGNVDSDIQEEHSRSSGDILGALDETPPDAPLGTPTPTTKSSHIVAPHSASQRGTASQQGDDNEYTPWTLIMKDVDPFVLQLMRASFLEFRQHLNDCLGWIDKIIDPKMAVVSSLQQMINRNVRLYFATSDSRDTMAKKWHIWSRRFGETASAIIRTYDVIVPRFPYHNLFQNSDLADKIIRDLLDSNRQTFPKTNSPYIYAIQWLPETKDNGTASLVISVYNAVYANNVISSGIDHQVIPSTVERFDCLRYNNPAELIQYSACWQYSHTEFDCEESRCCVYCGGSHDGSGHSGLDRKNPKCVLCAGAHKANSVDCPVRKFAQQQSDSEFQNRSFSVLCRGVTAQ